jgi:hypothetical protein
LAAKKIYCLEHGSARKKVSTLLNADEVVIDKNVEFHVCVNVLSILN